MFKTRPLVQTQVAFINTFLRTRLFSLFFFDFAFHFSLLWCLVPCCSCSVFCQMSLGIVFISCVLSLACPCVCSWDFVIGGGWSSFFVKHLVLANDAISYIQKNACLVGWHLLGFWKLQHWKQYKYRGVDDLATQKRMEKVQIGEGLVSKPVRKSC